MNADSDEPYTIEEYITEGKPDEVFDDLRQNFSKMSVDELEKLVDYTEINEKL